MGSHPFIFGARKQTAASATVLRDGAPYGTVASGGLIDVPSQKTLTLIVAGIAAGHTTATITITSASAGTIASVAADGLTTLAITVNAAPISYPQALVATDVVVLTFDAAAGGEEPTFTGTYT